MPHNECGECINFNYILPEQECEKKQLHPIPGSLYPRGQELYQICSIRVQTALY